MEQLGLFEERKRVIVDDASGSIVYHPRAVAFERAQALFAVLMREVEWRSERRMMYEHVSVSSM